MIAGSRARPAPPPRNPSCVPAGHEVLPGSKANFRSKEKGGGNRGQAAEPPDIHLRTLGPMGVTERVAAVPGLTGARTRPAAALETPPRVEQRPPSHARHGLPLSGKWVPRLMPLALPVSDGSIGQPLPAQDACVLEE